MIGYSSLPGDGALPIDLTAARGELTVTWIVPTDDTIVPAGKTTGGVRREFKPPFAAPAVLHLKAGAGQ